MKNRKTEIVLLVIAILVVSFFAWRKYRKGENLAIGQYNAQFDTIRHKTDAKGRDVAEMNVAPMPAAIFNASQDSTIKALRKELGSAKNLLQYTRVQLRTKDSLLIKIGDRVPARLVDTGQGNGHVVAIPDSVRPFEYAGDWLQASGYIKDSILAFNYEYKIDVSLKHYWKRDKWYKRKHLALQVVPMDPHCKVDTFQTFVIEQPPKVVGKIVTGAAAILALMALLSK